MISEDGNENDFGCEHLTRVISRELQVIEKLEEDTSEFVDKVMRFIQDIASTDSQGETVSQRTSCIEESS